MCVSGLSCFRGRLIKGHFEVSTEREIQVDLHFCCILNMEKVHTESTASDGAMRRLFGEFEKAFVRLSLALSNSLKSLFVAPSDAVDAV